MKNSTNKAVYNDQYTSPVFKFRQLFITQKLSWLISWILGLVTVFAIIGLLMQSGWFISAAAFAGMVSLGSQSFNYLVPAGVIRMMAMARTAGRYGELLTSHHAVFGLLQQLRVQFFDRFAQLLPWQLPNNLRSVFTMHRLTYDIDVLDEFALRVVSPWWVAVVTSATVTLVVSSMLFKLPLRQGWVLMAAIGLIVATLIVPLVTMLKGIDQAKYQQNLAEQRRVTLIEPLSALTHLIMWQRWQSEWQKFQTIDQAYQQQQRHTQRVRGLTILMMQWLIAAVIVVVLYLIGTASSLALTQATLNVPIVLALILGIMGLGEVVLPLAQNYLALGNSIAAKNRLNELLMQAYMAKSSDSQQVSLAKITKPLTLQVNALTAKQPAAIIGFSPISFDVQQGKPLLITGASGAGKSTLLQVLAKELLPLSGQIYLNEIELDKITFDNKVGYLGQQIDIFDQSLAQNLRLGKPNASDEELWQVLQKVGLDEWATRLPKQLNTRLGEYGRAVSGGQARRIALARLLLSAKKILLLDEPFAGLDSGSREKLWQMLVKEQKDSLLVVVTHHIYDNLDHKQTVNVQAADWI